MGLILYINGKQVDLEPGQTIAQTKQVNDLNSIENRQANYTNKFKVPKTAGNIKIMQFLSVTGNNSTIPYQKNECSLYSDTGECFVYKGRAVVADGGEYYNVTIYDGIIELFKVLENESLADIDLSELTHTKSVTSVKDSWNTSSNLKYRYILADYNGYNGSGNNLNIDYLAPSANVAWIWQKIFENYNITCSGSVFSTQEFKNLWMTYPKGLDSGESEEEIFLAEDTDVNPGLYAKSAYFFTTMSTSVLNDSYIYPQSTYRHIKFKTSGKYRIEVTGTVNSDRDFRIILGKNANNVSYPENVPNYAYIKKYQNMDEEITNASYTFDADVNDSFCVVMKKIKTNIKISTNHAIIRIVKVSENAYDFQDVFKEFPVKDFLKEVIHRFGLTIYKDKYSNHYTFLTLTEVLQNADQEDWSDKFIKKISENYILGNYAQRNWFRYSYNDKENAHNDGYIDVANINLEENKDVIKSKIYSPEKYTTPYLNGYSRVYKLWEKEIVEEPAEGESPVTYKSLDKRYYFLRAMPQTGNITLSSEYLNDNITASSYFIENFWKLSFFDIIQQYYNPLRLMLDTSKIVTTELWLKDNDIANFDFKKLYYIKQLSSYFVMNKIINYVPGKPTKCEMARVLYSPAAEVLPIKIYRVNVIEYAIQVYFTLNINVPWVTLEYSTDQTSWSTISFNPYNSYYSYYLSIPTIWYIRLKAENEYSNTVEIDIPSTQTIEIS